MKTRLRFTFLFILLIPKLSTSLLVAQTLKEVDLQTCYAKAIENYPLIRQYNLISKTKDLNISNASKAYLPQIVFNGQATYQSDVTKIDIQIPGFPSFEALTKDQYKIFAEVSQAIYDGGAVSKQKESIEAGQEVEKLKNDVEIYKIKERVQQMYFGVLLLKAQIKQTEALRKDLESQKDKLKAALENGTAYRANLDAIDAELLKLDQRTIEMNSGIDAFVKMLSQFSALQLNSETTFIQPTDFAENGLVIKRPELSLFDYQTLLIDKNLALNLTRNRPRLSAFLQGGYGKPGLNALKNEFQTYYIGGLRLQWNLSGLYNLSNDRNLSVLNKSLIQNQRDAFVFNTTLQTQQQSEDISKLKKLIKIDEDLIKLRTNIKKTSSVQLENGVITASDFIKEWSAEDQAKQTKLLHEIQLLSAQYLLKITTGNE
ncbi:MAG: TolC family protein [Saprospiraceae bacterium]|jgi:outer membrane protein TolC|nr:TolC family protein [Saprospiraceae bacterium]